MALRQMAAVMLFRLMKPFTTLWTDNWNTRLVLYSWTTWSVVAVALKWNGFINTLNWVQNPPAMEPPIPDRSPPAPPASRQHCRQNQKQIQITIWLWDEQACLPASPPRAPPAPPVKPPITFPSPPPVLLPPVTPSLLQVPVFVWGDLSLFFRVT